MAGWASTQADPQKSKQLWESKDYANRDAVNTGTATWS